MHIDRRRFIGATLAASVAACTTRSAAPPLIAATEPLPAPVPSPEQTRPADLPPLIAEALAALEAHSHLLAHRDRIGVVDFSLASREPRFHLVDAASARIERSWLVAHGSGSDPGHSGWLQHFSNQPGSNATSRGAYLTAQCYHGKYGRSQRLIGLDADNSQALDRAIVIHGAPYVDPALIAAQGRIGRSQGCFAFEHGAVGEVMDLLGEGRLIYAGKPA